METCTYPLLYWPIADGFLLGIVIGTGHSFVEANLKKLQTALARQLQQNLEEPRITGAQLKLISVTFRPVYRIPGRVYPSPSAIQVVTPAVYGKNQAGFFECFLPLLDESFYYYKQEQMDVLAENFVRDAIRQYTPEDVVRLLLPATPQLSEIQLKPSRLKRRKDRSLEDTADSGQLAKVADRYPRLRGEQKKMAVIPEVAWEQGEKVRAIAGMITVERANVLLVGEHGVGKTAILQQVAREIQRTDLKPADAFRPAFWRTSSQRIIAGCRYLGEWQLLCDELARELRGKKDVLWILDFIDMLKTGGGGPEDSMAAYFAADLRLGQLQVIAEATPRELDAARRLLPGFVEHFRTVFIEEMNRRTVLKVMTHFQSYAARHLEVEIENDALNQSYRLLERFVRQEKFPGKALAFLARCLNDALIHDRKAIDRRAVVDAFSEQTGMPELFLRDDLLLNKSAMDAWFARRIIGQEEALATMSTVVKIFKTGLSNPGKPISTLIFAGPTGVGKTASARALAQYFFGHGQKLDPLIRLDMSEFQHPSQVSRLIGAPDGSDPGRLVREVRERPFCVLLLDEIEKAHPAIFDVLLTVLDEGILADVYGRITDFRNAIIIMTSNLGAAARSSIGFSGKDEINYRAAISSFFRPEFCNRVDEIVVFHPLREIDIAAITRKELSEMAGREGFAERGLQLEFSEELIVFLSREGFHARYGARPLQRTIERHVVGALARHLLRNPALSHCRLQLDFDGSRMTIRQM